MYRLIKQDFLAQFAAASPLSVKLRALLFGRGFHLLLLFRLQQGLRKIPYLGTFFARVVWYISGIFFPCDISPLANIEGGLYLPHPLGIVVGEGVYLGRGCVLYQNVTLGRKNAQSPGYPCIEERVSIGAGSVLLGPIIVGECSVIGANSVVLSSVPKFAVAMGAPAVVRKLNN